jgi:cytochrome P450
MSDVQASDAEQAAARSALFNYFRTLAEEKRRRPSNDVASMLVQGQVDGMPMTQAALDAYFLLLTVAGNETTRFLLSNGLAALMAQPDGFIRLRKEPSLIPVAVEEMCRYVSPVMHMRRTTSRALDLFGTSLPKGAKVILWFNAANRDPAQFTDPHRLLLDRTPNRHVGFGVGAHFCMGAHLARLEAQIFWQEFSRHINKIQPAGTPQPLISNWFNGLTALPIIWS